MVKLDQYEANITALMERLKPYGIEQGFAATLPSIIHITLPEDIKGTDVALIRIFLKALRKANLNYFVRFTTNVLWVIESDNGDMFYGKDDFEGHYRNVILDLRIIDHKDIEVFVKVPIAGRQEFAVKKLSKALNAVIPTKTLDSIDTAVSATLAFYVDLHGPALVNYFNDPFYLLFVPDASGENLYPIVLWGMTVYDAKRRYLSSDRDFERHRYLHNVEIESSTPLTQTMYELVLQIQIALEGRNRRESASEVHSLAELLFGYIVQQMEEERDEIVRDKEIIVIDTVNGNDVAFYRVVNLKTQYL